MSTPELIAEYTAQLLLKYDALKAGDRSVPFWDVVVVCCSAEPRVEAAFRRCVSHHALPPSATYRVLADPPGPSVECGGATLHALHVLRREYGGRLDQLKVMLIHAGGFSKRLLHHAALGKLFSPLAVGDRGITMLDLKLTMYLPYVPLLPPGVFVTGCDDIQLAWLPPQLPVDLFVDGAEDFVALAHPAPISVAVNHGVYVLPSTGKKENEYLYTSPCEEVLQKPTEQLMRERGAVFMLDGCETVHIDGTFWLGAAAQRCLLQLYDRLRPLTEELSAYRDLLPCLGRRADSHHQAVVSRLAADSPRALTNQYVRRLRLSVLVVPRSRFFHLGTVREYARHVVGGGALTAALRLRQRCHSLGAPQPGVLVHSVVSAAARLPRSALAEFCRLDGAVAVGDGALLCHVHLAAPARPPAHTLLHTVAVTARDGRRRHVTLAVGVRDDVKGAALLLGRPVAGAAALWTARLFPDADTMPASAAATLAALAAAPYRVDDRLWSMADAMAHSDPERMLEFREQLLGQVDAAGDCG